AARTSSVSWIVVPSYTPKTEEFLAEAKRWAREGVVVLFAAADDAYKLRAISGAVGACRPPGLVNSTTQKLAAFVNLPSSKPLVVWFDEGDPPTTPSPRCTIGIPTLDTWEGLIFELSFTREDIA